MFIYINSEPGLYTVGYYSPSGEFIPESDHPTTSAASKRVAFLNGQNFREEEDEKEEFIEKTRREWQERHPV